MNDLCRLDQIEYMNELQADQRKGVQDLILKTKKNHIKMEKEIVRLKKLTEYELAIKEEGYVYIAGIDEVGRGPLAGPVVTAAVVLDELTVFEGINDSKKVSEKNRNRLFDEITEKAIDISIGMAWPEEIDEYNILGATKLAMKRAVEGLKRNPDHLLIDAVKLDDIPIRQTSLIKGDEKSVSIAAASIIAKVTRDRMMVDYDLEYPAYDFASNKGYGTAKHYEGLNKEGYTQIHRKSFIKDFI